MILYFRLLAGLTSLFWNLNLSHFCASGPAGILESSVAMLLRNLLSSDDGDGRDRRGSRQLVFLFRGVIIASDSEEDCQWNDGVTNKDGDARHLRERLNSRPPDVIAKAQGLEHCGNAVPEMHEEEPLRGQIEQHHPPDLEPENHHGVNVRNRLPMQVGSQFSEIPYSIDTGQQHREMRQVIEDESENHQATDNHRARGRAGAVSRTARVAFRSTRLSIHGRQSDGCRDMKDNAGEQS